MKTTYQPQTLLFSAALTALFILLSFVELFAGSYVWTGNTSSSFSTSYNWNPNGTPGATDTILISTGTANNCVLGANESVYQVTVNADTLDLNGNVLSVYNHATISAGRVSGGTLAISGTGTAIFSGGTITSAVTISCSSIQFSGTTFEGSVTAVKTGSSSSSSGDGGCTFGGNVNLIDSSSGTWTFASVNPDNFSEKVTVTQTSSGNIFFCHNSSGNVFSKSLTFTNTSSGAIYCSYYGDALMHDSVILNSTGTKGIFFGTGGGVTTLDTSVLAIGSLGLTSSGTLQLENVRQQDQTKAISLTATGTFAIIFGRDNILDGDWTVSSPELKLYDTRFNGKATLTHTGDKTNSSSGGCYYSDSVLIIHDNATGGNFFTGTSTADVFAAPVTIRNAQKGKIGVVNAVFMDKARFENYSVTANSVGGVGSGTPGQTFLVADAGTCTFQDTLTLDNDTAATSFGTSSGSVVFEEDAALNVLTTYYGDLILSGISQSNESTFNIPFANNPGILALDSANSFAGPFTCQVQRIRLNSNVFSSTFTLTRTSTYSDTCKGGNVFLRPAVITDTNSASVSLILSYYYPDEFASSVTFRNFGSGEIFPCHTMSSSFKGDIIIDGSKAITFGYGGGRAIIEGEAEHLFSKLGSYQPTLKKLEMKKDGGLFTLTMPITVDSVFFTKGFLVTDSANLLKIPDNGVVTGASDSSFVIGAVSKTGNEAIIFPLGSVDGEGTGFYHPLTISAPSSATDAFTARYLYQNHNLGLVTDTAIENPSLCEHWKLLRDTGTSNVTVKLGWNTNSCNVFGLDSMHVAVWDTASDKWLDKGNNGTTGTISVGTVVSDSALSAFGVITLADKFCTSLKPIVSATDVTCPGYSDGTAKVIATGATPPYSYNWSPQTGGSISIWDLSAGEYYISVTDSRGCSVTDSVEINNPDTIELEITTTNSDCHDSIGTAKVEATGGSGNQYAYFWIPGGQKTDSIGELPAGIYEVVVSDNKGCSVDTTVCISDSDGPDAEIDSLVDVDCFGSNTGFASINCTGCPSEHDPSWPCIVADPTRIAAGTYPVISEDEEGCLTILNVTITEPEPIVLDISTTPSSCGDSTGTASVIVSGGTGSFSYQWSTGGTDSIETGIHAGPDTLIVTDENGCISKAIVVVTDEDTLSLSATKTDALCWGDSSGSAAISVSGGTSPYHYSWYSGSPDSATLSNLIQGDYIISVIDSNGCIDTIAISINAPQPLTSIVYTTSATDTLNNGTASVEVFNGTPPYSYLWSIDSLTSQSIDEIIPGEHSLTVTDDNGCESERTFLISIDNLLNSTSCSGNTAIMSGCSMTSNPCISYPCTLNIMNSPFNAEGDGVADDECAFEMASDWLNTYWSAGELVLEIPYGVYLIGRQDQVDGFHRRGHHVFCLEGCQNFKIIGIPEVSTGNLPVLKYKECMKFGAFVPDIPISSNSGDRYLPCPPGEFRNLAYAAYPGSLFKLIDCDNGLIQDLELDGNIDNLEIGGYFNANNMADGIAMEHDGVLLYNTTNLTLNNLNAHHFGRDGLAISPFHYIDPMIVYLYNCKFNENCRTGFAWTGGPGLYAYGCEFNSNSLGRYSGRTQAGMDIEHNPSSGAIPPGNGHFYFCEFKYNLVSGIMSNYLNGVGFNFTECLFVGSESSPLNYKGTPSSLTAKKVRYNCCDFYGPMMTVYDAEITSINNLNDYETRFLNCSFNEEYEVSGTTYSFTPDCIVNCANPTEDVPFHQSLVYFGDGSPAYSRVTFDQCVFNSNYNLRLCWLAGRSAPPFGVTTLNYQVIKNCTFFNGGLNAYYHWGSDPCPTVQVENLYLFGFSRVNFIGNVNLDYRMGNARNVGQYDYLWGLNQCHRYGGPFGVAFGNFVYPWWNSFFSNVNHTNSYLPCHDRYPDLSVTPLVIHGNCPNGSIDALACSGGGQRFGIENISSNEYIDSSQPIKISPNPTTNIVKVECDNADEIISIYDVYGGFLMQSKIIQKETIINVYDLPPGVYFISVGNKKFGRFVKQ